MNKAMRFCFTSAKNTGPEKVVKEQGRVVMARTVTGFNKLPESLDIYRFVTLAYRVFSISITL